MLFQSESSEIVAVGSWSWLWSGAGYPAQYRDGRGLARHRDGMNSGTTSARPAAASSPLSSIATKPAP